MISKLIYFLQYLIKFLNDIMKKIDIMLFYEKIDPTHSKDLMHNVYVQSYNVNKI